MALHVGRGQRIIGTQGFDPLRLEHQLRVRGKEWKHLIRINEGPFSSSTLTKLKAGKPVDADTATRLVAWLRKHPPIPELLDLARDGEPAPQ